MPEKHRDLAKTHAADSSARAAEIVATLRTGEPTDVFDAFWQLDKLPVDEVKDALTAWIGPLPDIDRLEPAVRLAHGLPLRALRLRTLSVATDADILDLGPVAEEQLRLAGKSWDGAELSAEDRLDGELDGSFAGTLERRVLADADAPGEAPLFDVLLFAEDSGVVFAAGTTNVVALIAYRKVEMKDRRTRVALEEAVAAPGVVPSVTKQATAEVTPSLSIAADAASDAAEAEEPADPEDREEDLAPSAAPTKTPRVAARKKPVAKKAATKKAATKTAAKKTAAKKTAAKKTAAKPVKKAAAKKAVVKKTAAKKTAKKAAPVAKKTAAKKVAAKKPVAKKAVAKKAAKKRASSSKR